MDKQIYEKIKQYAKKHMDATEDWPHGGIQDFWIDQHGAICIQYEDGSWWHYKEYDGNLEWW